MVKDEIVHFFENVEGNVVCRAAIVVSSFVDGDGIEFLELDVATLPGQFTRMRNIPPGEPYAVGTWHPVRELVEAAGEA